MKVPNLLPTVNIRVFIEKKHTSSLFIANNNIAVWIIGYCAGIFAEQALTKCKFRPTPNKGMGFPNLKKIENETML